MTLTGGDSIQATGAIDNYATLTIEHSVITGNYGGTGGIYNGGFLTVRNSTISGNQGDVGDGISALGRGMVISDSVISDNTATSFGGGGGVFGRTLGALLWLLVWKVTPLRRKT